MTRVHVRKLLAQRTCRPVDGGRADSGEGVHASLIKILHMGIVFDVPVVTAIHSRLRRGALTAPVPIASNTSSEPAWPRTAGANTLASADDAMRRGRSVEADLQAGA